MIADKNLKESTGDVTTIQEICVLKYQVDPSVKPRIKHTEQAKIERKKKKDHKL